MVTKNWLIDGKELVGAGGATLKWEDRKYFTLEYKGQVYNGEILNENTENNVLDIKINHRVFQVKKQGPLDNLIASLGMDKPKIKKLKELTAPMPGRIVSLAVQVGQALEVGSEILSLEAMKMENVFEQSFLIR